MRLVKLSEIFDLRYGNQFNFNEMEEDITSDINFISRSSKNMGIEGKVAKHKNIEPFNPGLITVTLGGTYLLSSFLQQKTFYTAQNIKVLSPKKDMSDMEKLFYCYCISQNRFRYTSHGREANSTIDDLLVPEKIPNNWKNININKINNLNKRPLLNSNINLSSDEWEYFKISDLFYIEKGNDTRVNKKEGKIPLIMATSENNGVGCLINDGKKLFTGNSISVSSNGSIGEAFYQEKDFYATGDVNILKPKFELDKFIAIFIISIIRQEKYRFSYGRKWGKSRMEESQIKLPTIGNQPDWDFMRDYIKSITYSSSL